MAGVEDELEEASSSCTPTMIEELVDGLPESRGRFIKARLPWTNGATHRFGCEQCGHAASRLAAFPQTGLSFALSCGSRRSFQP
jgi:hypothetical protein